MIVVLAILVFRNARTLYPFPAIDRCSIFEQNKNHG